MAAIPAIAPGRVWKFGDDINTDLMLPGPLLQAPAAEQVRAVFAANRPGWVDLVRQGETRRFLHGFQNDRRSRAAHPWNAPEAMTQELPDVLGVPGAHLQQKAIVSGDVVHFQYLRTGGERAGNRVFAGCFLALDGHEREHRLLNHARVEQSHVAPDGTSGLELPQALEHR